MDYLTKAVPLELKALEDDGSFSGYGSVFGNTDRGGDIVAAGAFSKSLKEWKKSGRTVPVLWQHRTDEPIGGWPDLKEDSYGLLGEAELWLDDAPYARIAHKGMKTKTITGLSIGYRIKKYSVDQETGIYTLKELDLVEISVVTNPMNDLARVESVKSMVATGQLPTVKQFEDFLREVGFSKTQAAAIAVHGLSKLHRGEPDSTKGEVLQLLNDFKLSL